MKNTFTCFIIEPVLTPWSCPTVHECEDAGSQRRKGFPRAPQLLTMDSCGSRESKDLAGLDGLLKIEDTVLGRNRLGVSLEEIGARKVKVIKIHDMISKN